MRKHLSRPHIGKVPMKFYFRAQDICVLLPGMDVAGKLVLTWKRGPRRTTTEPFAVKEKLNNIDGTLVRKAATSQDLALICTMFKNSKSGVFESKSAAFTLKEEIEGGEERKLGSVTIDLSSYATPEVSADAVELSFCEGKILLKLTLSSHWLKHMKATGDDEDAASIGSYASSFADIEEQKASAALTSLPHVCSTGEKSSRGSISNGSINGATGSAAYVPLSAAERARQDAQREEAIEKSWVAEEARLRDGEQLEALRQELQEANDKLQHALSECKYLRDKADRLAQENRVLRREQRGGKRDEVILQLETELQAKEDERADMEENLANAFSEVVKDLSTRVASLTLERDRLLVSLEGATSRRKV